MSNWYEGERFDMRMGNALFYDEGGYHTRVPVEVRDRVTGKLYSRVGDWRQIGNFHPVWINWKGKKITVEEMLQLKS